MEYFNVFLCKDTGAGGESSDDDRNTVGENRSSNDTVLMPFVNNTQQIVLNDTCDVSTRMLTGDNLVAAPNKVTKSHLFYFSNCCYVHRLNR